MNKSYVNEISLTELDAKGTKNGIENFIADINKDKSITHFEFIKNPKNWSLLENFFKDKSIKIENLHKFTAKNPESDTFNSLKENLFYMDFKSLFCQELEAFVKKEELFNIKLMEINRDQTGDLSAFFTQENLDDKNKYLFAYTYIVEDVLTINFSIQYVYSTEKFEIKMDLTCPYIVNKQSEMNKAEVKLYKKLLEDFKCKNESVHINFATMKKFINMFLHDINRFNLTNNSAVNYVKSKSPYKDDVTTFFLESKFDMWSITSHFVPASKKGQEYDKSKSRDLFYFKQAYLECLYHDLQTSLGNTFFESKIKLNEINIIFKKIGCTYDIKFSEYQIISLYADDIHMISWRNFKKEKYLRNTIINYIKSDISRLLKRGCSIEKEILSEFDELFKAKFKNIDIAIQSTPFYQLSLEELTQAKIPYILSFNDNILEKHLSLNELKENKDLEFNIFCEKVKIFSELIDDSTGPQKIVKRL